MTPKLDFLLSISNEPLALSGSVASALHAYLSEEQAGDSFFGILPNQVENLEKAKEEASGVVIGMAMGSNADLPGAASAERKIAVIHMSGLLMPFTYYYLGADYLSYLLTQADQEPNIDAIVLDMNCPGGSVQASETLADCIKSLSKPVVTFVNKLACSGGYWVAANTAHIMARVRTGTGPRRASSPSPRRSEERRVGKECCR